MFTPEVQHWSSDIRRWADQYDLPVPLVATVMQIESCGHPEVRSSAGALGLFQVMPFHFGPKENPLDPETNAARGLNYLSRSLELAGGDFRLALVGYNAGHSAIHREPSGWPAETRRYLRWGIQILDDYQRGRSASPAVQAWLEAGGAALCERAAAYLSAR